MGRTTKMFLTIAIVFTFVWVAWGTARSVKDVQFARDCTRYLQTAVDVDNVETAKEELSKAIQYAEEHNLTEGVVSIFFNRSKNDIGMWYKNMKTAHEKLENLPEDATENEKANILMQLGETLTTNGQNGRFVTVPEGIFVYPNNVAYFWWGLISFMLAGVFWLAFDISRTYD